jgi:hypothetical protein
VPHGWRGRKIRWSSGDEVFFGKGKTRPSSCLENAAVVYNDDFTTDRRQGYHAYLYIHFEETNALPSLQQIEKALQRLEKENAPPERIGEERYALNPWFRRDGAFAAEWGWDVFVSGLHMSRVFWRCEFTKKGVLFFGCETSTEQRSLVVELLWGMEMAPKPELLSGVDIAPEIALQQRHRSEWPWALGGTVLGAGGLIAALWLRRRRKRRRSLEKS